jgi:pyruvate carboxylase subunit A
VEVDLMLNKVLVANRGEIALRIMRACKELGIETVAVYSEADNDALFTNYADEKHLIGPPPPLESYLKMDAIIDAAIKSKAEAIHPGYGFLAENDKFSDLVEKSGLVFVGPTGQNIREMGSKLFSKKTMKSSGVPVVPGTEEGISDIEKAKNVAHEIGYPVILKASAGGGGIGMRIVNSDEELSQAVESTQRVAKSAFGDETVLLEKYLEEPRHVEFQIMCDNHGNVVHLRERECSIQRRHQKLIEETPSCVMTDELRDKMGCAAVAAAKVVNYRNAGTVEFMYSKGNFYFLEMNTRLQVEHPITEMITGVDLAKEQLRIASGLPLQFNQEDIKGQGWAFECRICAEDPQNNFFPSPGKIVEYTEPSGPGIRVDSGVYGGFDVPPYYDSLLSKLCVWGRDRKEAMDRMKRALWEYKITGIKTNIPFHEVVLNNEYFAKGEYTTHFIKERNILDDVKKYCENKG